LEEFGGETPVFLVGNKTDVIAETNFGAESPDRVTTADGNVMAGKIRGSTFFECSAKTHVGIDQLLTAVTASALEYKRKNYA
jgi:GTPase SAR1 family protein